MAIKQCVICGKDYELCKSCNTKLSYQPWRVVTDTAEHYKVFLALHDYGINKNKDKAKDLLSACDLSDINTYVESIKETINAIKGSDEEVKSVSVATAVETPIANTGVEATSETAESEQPVTRRKKKNSEKPSEI